MSVVSERELAGIKEEIEKLAAVLEGADGMFEGDAVAGILRDLAEGATADAIVEDYDITSDDGV